MQSDHEPAIWRAMIAESFGTFCLVFAGTGAIVINDVSRGAITHVGISLTFGLIVLSMIYTIGDVSGCHINPAVTIGMLASGRMSRNKAVAFMLSQLAGAMAASGLLRLLLGAHPTLGATLPAGSALQSWVLEFVLTMMLMVVILKVSTGSKEQGLLAGVAIGAVIALEALFAGPISGASMNPARSLAPAVFAGKLTSLWIYLTAPPSGAIVGVLIWRTLQNNPSGETVKT